MESGVRIIKNCMSGDDNVGSWRTGPLLKFKVLLDYRPGVFHVK